MSQRELTRVTILGMPGALPTTIAGPLDVFTQAGQLWPLLCDGLPSPFFTAELVSEEGRVIECLNHLSIPPHRALAEVQDTDLIIVTAADISTREQWRRTICPWLQRHSRTGAKLAGICTGAFVLAEAGLLDQRQATTHWGFVKQFRSWYPQVDLRPERMLTKDNNVYCSGGINAYAELCLFLVEEFCGYQVAEQCARSLVLEGRRQSQTPYAILRYQKQHGDAGVLKAQEFLERRFSQSIEFGALAKEVAMSERNFKRRFKKATGDTPLEYLQRLRIEQAKRELISSAAGIDQIAGAVGYQDTAHFRALFRKYTGLTPSDYRKRTRVAL